MSSTAIPIGVKFCMMVHIGPGQEVSSFGGGITRGTPKSHVWAGGI